jgi:hypothetical protein
MEIAVILAAGLQDWIDFGVIVSFHIVDHVTGVLDCCIHPPDRLEYS